MRAPVYRNLDLPLEIFGFNPWELIVLCISFVGGGELSEFIGIHRAWSFVLTINIGIGLFLFRRTMGHLFGFRLWRFVDLPRSIGPRLFASGDKI